MTDDEFEAEIVRRIAAAADTETPGVLVEYIVIAATIGVDNDGDDSSLVGYFPSSHGTPRYRLMGLLAYADAIIRGQVLAEDG